MSSLRLLLYCTFAPDEPLGQEFAPWAELCVALGVLFAPFAHHSGRWRLVFSFPSLLLSLIKILEDTSESRRSTLLHSLYFDCALNEEFRDIKGQQLYETLRKIAEYGPTPMSTCIDFFYQIQRSIETPTSQNLLSSFVSSITALRDFFSGVDFGAVEIMVDLFNYPVSPAVLMTSSLYFTMHSCGVDEGSFVLGSGAVTPGDGLWWAEFSIEGLARSLNHNESLLYKRDGSIYESCMITHLASPRVLILMQRSNCQLSLSLLSRLQLVGIQADCIVVPMLNMTRLRREVPRTSMGVLFLVMVNHKDASNVLYKVDHLIPADVISCPSFVGRGPRRLWKTETLSSENAVFAFILGHVSRTKSSVRSLVLRECSRFTYR